MSNPISPNQNQADLASQYRVAKAQREELEQTSETELDNMKKGYAAQKADLEDRFEKSLQSDKLSHYDHLRNTQSQINREERQLDQAKNQILSQKQSQFAGEERKIEEDGRSKIQNLQRQYAAAEEVERNKEIAANMEVSTTHKRSAENILKTSEKQLKDLQEQKAQFVEKAKDTHVQSLNEIQVHYDGMRTGVQKQYSEEFKNLKVSAAEDLNQRRLSTMASIQNYADRANDSFYRMKRFDTELTDAGDSFSLRVKVPSYERGQFRVQVSGQEVQITGVRSNNERAEVEPGRWISTASHQNVSERFPLDAPVDGRLMTMKEDGEWLVYTLPKFGPSHRMTDLLDQKKISQEELAVISTLDFPKSLPKVTAIADKSGKGPLSTS